MNTTPLSAIQKVLLNKKEGKKSKFTVELEEREENGKSRVRIDIWVADEQTPETDRSIGQSVHALTRDSSTPNGPMIQRNRQYPSPHLTFKEDIRPCNRSPQNKSPPDDGLQEKFYRITPACDSDVSMRSVSENLPANDNLNTERAQSPDDSNRNEQHNEGQDLEGGQCQPPEHFDSTNSGARNENENPIDESMDAGTQRFCVYEEKSQCAQPHLRLRQITDIPSVPKGNCLFDSLIKVTGLKITAIELRNKLLDSPALADCGDLYGACMILSSQNEYRDADSVYIFSRTYKRNICIHLHSRDKVWYLHYRNNEESEYVHQYLEGLHFRPYLPIEESATTAQPPDTSRASMPAGEEYEPIRAVVGSNSEDAGEVASAQLIHPHANTVP